MQKLIKSMKNLSKRGRKASKSRLFGRQEVFVGGEALALSTCRSWLQKWPHVRLVVNYATTETVRGLEKRPRRLFLRRRTWHFSR